MALIKCPECQKEVSDKALTCPHCGYQLRATSSGYTRWKIKEQQKKHKALIIAGIIFLITAIVLLFFLGNPIIKSDGYLLGTVVGGIIGSAIGGIVLIIVGVHRLNN